RDAMRITPKQPTNKAPRPPKQHTIYDFQFYPPRLNELQEKEVLFYRKSIGYKVPKAVGAEAADLDEETLEAQQKEEQAKIDNATPLTEDEIAEKEELAEQVISN